MNRLPLGALAIVAAFALTASAAAAQGEVLTHGLCHTDDKIIDVGRFHAGTPGGFRQ